MPARQTRHSNLPRSVKSHPLLPTRAPNSRSLPSAIQELCLPGRVGYPSMDQLYMDMLVMLCPGRLPCKSHTILAAWKGSLSPATQLPGHCRARAKPSDAWQTRHRGLQTPCLSFLQIFLDFLAGRESKHYILKTIRCCTSRGRNCLFNRRVISSQPDVTSRKNFPFGCSFLLPLCGTVKK